MNSTVIAIVGAVAGGVVTGFYNVWVQKTKNIGTNEGIYAEHTDSLLDRLDKITGERNDLKEQVIKLNAKIDEQSKIIDQLTKQMGDLNTKFNTLEEEK